MRCRIVTVAYVVILNVDSGKLQGEAEDERAVAAAQIEAGSGVEREVALLQTRLRLLAKHALVSLPCHILHCFSAFSCHSAIPPQGSQVFDTLLCSQWVSH